jgi:hypothetical protein
MSTVVIETYDFSELSPEAKENALMHYATRDSMDVDLDWYKDDSQQYGFDVEDIKYSGFGSQGDGALWSGTASIGTFLDKHLLESHVDYPRYVILRELLNEGWVDDTAKISTRRMNYSHSGMMSISTDYQAADNCDFADGYLEEGVLKGASVHQLCLAILIYTLMDSLERWILEEARGYADKMYAALQEEYEYLQSPEVFQETCDANEWRFNELGWLA